MEKVRLGDLVEFSNGYAFKSSDYIDDSNTLNCRMSNIRPDGSFDIRYSAKYLPDSFVDKYSDYILKDGDLIIAMTDMAGDPKILGIPTVVKTEGYNVLMNQRVGKLTLKTNAILPEYLKYSLSSKQTREYFKSFAGGGVQLNIGKKEILNTMVCIRDIIEQKHIVKILSKIIDLINKRKEQLSKFEEIVKARFVELFGDPVDNPMKWPVKKLKELSVQINSGNTPKGGSEVYVEKGITFFRSQNVWKDRLEMDDIAYIDEETHLSMKRSSLKHGDILMTKTGRINTENSSLGRAALYLGEDDAANVNGHVYFIRLKPDVNNHFVLRILVSKEYRDLIRRVCVGGIDKRQLNKEHIEDFPIICPPTDMIEDYIAFVKQTDKSKLEVQKSLGKLELLKKALMQKYFG